MTTKQVTSYTKPKKCPSCGSKKVENILYNEPPVTKKPSGKSCETDSAPKWQCHGCGVKIYLKTSRRCRGN